MSEQKLFPGQVKPCSIRPTQEIGLAADRWQVFWAARNQKAVDSKKESPWYAAGGDRAEKVLRTSKLGKNITLVVNRWPSGENPIVAYTCHIEDADHNVIQHPEARKLLKGYLSDSFTF